MSTDVELYKELVPDQQYNNIFTNYQNALHIVDDIVLKNYVANINKMKVVPLSHQVLESNIKENVRLFKISEMVYEKDEFSTYKFASVFNALSTTDSALILVIDSDGQKTDFYMGVRSLDSDRTTSSLKNTLQNAMQGQFPGIKTKDFTEEEMEEILDRIKGNSISSVSCVANSKDSDDKSNSSFIQGLEKLVLSMQGNRYTGIIVGNGTKQEQLVEIRKEYENIYTQLSPFATSQLNYSNNTSVNISNSFTSGASIGKTHTNTKSITEGITETIGKSKTKGLSKEGAGSKTVKGIASAAGILGAALAPVTGGASLVAGGVISGGLGLLGNAITKTESESGTTNTSESKNYSEQNGTSDAVSESKNESSTDTKGSTNGITQGITLSMQDKSIINMLERIDTQLKRLQEFESLGMYECAAYFLSDNQYTSEIAASTYKAIMKGENSGVEVAAVNSWGKYDGEKTKLIYQYVTNFIHPVFEYNSPMGNIEVTPSSLVSGSELAIHMGLPRKSICGFPVIEHADFGKEVVNYNQKRNYSELNLGKIFNMGSVCNNSVKLDRNSLSMHTFITGSTGSGKSNTVYEILRQLSVVGINFMIIEPAKGEYKNIFGNIPGVKVLGTNSQYTQILRINPFKFPQGIHILEHIDRLVEIFNVCWPMYAAMPAVLKEALLKSYEVCGWNLNKSKNMYSDNLFPTFKDLLVELINVVQNSAYSEEVKSNYIGSLVTRVRSLTNGLNGQIFSAQEINNNELFDKNVIIDLSRIGSMETKSLVMGILVMRLSEHRMSNANEMNQPLKHVTVLEEAHNILKRTSSEQNPEAPSMAGKSVEMISNAIAEMRTYGEGFIIADQSPSAVDISAIRNTNTKIIMRLPDESDRRLAGKAASLKDEQLDEIAKLPKGVAVVYQNDWLEPVLCKVSKYRGEEHKYEYKTTNNNENDMTDKFKTKILQLLLKNRVAEQIECDIDELFNLLDISDLSVKNKIIIRKILNEYKRTENLFLWKEDKFSELATVVTEIIDGSILTKNAINMAEDFEQLTEMLFEFIDEETEALSREFKLATSQCLLKYESEDNADKNEIYAAWITNLKNKAVY